MPSMRFEPIHSEPYHRWQGSGARVEIGRVWWDEDDPDSVEWGLRYWYPDVTGVVRQTKTIPLGVALQVMGMLQRTLEEEVMEAEHLSPLLARLDREGLLR